MIIQTICDIIILIGAVVSAIVAIINFFAKPTSKLKRRKIRKNKELLKSTLDELMPKYLEDHDQLTRQKYLADRQRYLKEIAQEVLNNTSSQLDNIQKINEQQSEIIDLLRKNVVDILRQKIERIYFKYESCRKIPRYEKENLEDLYSDYKRGGGNHHIDKLYNRMKEWEITDEERGI